MAAGGGEAEVAPEAEWKRAAPGIFASFCKGGGEKGGARVSPAALSQPAWRGSARRGGPLGRAPGRALPTLAAPAPRRPSFPPLPARRHFVAWALLAVAWPGGHFVKRAAGGAAPAVPRAAATRGRGGAVVPEAGSPRPPPPPSFVRQISSFCYVFLIFFSSLRKMGRLRGALKTRKGGGRRRRGDADRLSAILPRTKPSAGAHKGD